MIKIYTFAHKRPDFIELQLKSFKKNLKDEFEFIIFNNANFDHNKNQYNEIHKICKELKLQCIDIKIDFSIIKNRTVFENNEYINPAIACAYPLCYAWKEIISKTNDKICIIDSDMFIFKQFDVCKILSNYDLVYLPQSRNNVYYMWNGLVFMNLKNMPNKSYLSWWCGLISGENTDVGGNTFYYLNKYRNKLRIGSLIQHHITEDNTCDFQPPNYEYFSIDNNERFIWHYRGGSGWDKKSQEYHDKKTQWLKNKLQS